MKNLMFIVFILSSFVFFSCGDEKPDTTEKDSVKPEGKDIKVCNLVDETEIEKIFNVEMKEPKEGRSQKGDSKKASFSECSFESDTDDSKIFLSVYLRFTPVRDEYHSTIKNVRNSFKKSGIEIRNIEGIGEVVFWGGNQLHVFIGNNYYLIITLLGIIDQDEAIKKAKEVAMHVMGNVDSV